MAIINQIDEDPFNRIILDPDFESKIAALKRVGMDLPPPVEFKAIPDAPFQNGKLVLPKEGIAIIPLDPKRGMDDVVAKHIWCAYDESIINYPALEGSAYLNAHALVLASGEKYLPMIYISFNFYTRSQEVLRGGKSIKKTDDPDHTSQIDRMLEKIDFLMKYTPEGSILLIDGPLIAGDAYTYMIRAVQGFLEKRIVPIFFVKNSSSCLVVDNVPELKSRYNSDLHWAYKTLKAGERTFFFEYIDSNNECNSKYFAYIKAFDSSPQRIEVHRPVYNSYRELVESIPEAIYYFLLAQGNPSNPQARPIAVAEEYARESIKLVDIKKVMKQVGLVPTINEVRFGD